MGILDIFKRKPTEQELMKAEYTKRISASGGGSPLYVQSFTGEKNLGELGPAIDYRPAHHELRIRSWQAYMESDIARTIIRKYTLWIIDRGLKLKSNPSKTIKGLNTEAFNEEVESRFNVWASSKMSSYNGMVSLNSQAKEAFKNAALGGDCLVVLRYIDGVVKVQLIDGAYVQSPIGYISLDSKIVDGVECDENGKHIAYHVRTDLLTYERIPAISKTGFVTAFLVYGERYKISTRRGIPLIGTVLETIKKIERYREAAVGSAEERQKIVLAIKHHIQGTGESPFAEAIVRARKGDTFSNVDLPEDDNGNALADKVYATTNKQTFNLPPGAELQTINSTQEMFFKDFFSTNADIICATINIPPNVAFSIYNDSFSASRAATKDWDHTIEVTRADFQEQFYQRIYNFWLFTEILKGNIQAPGYLEAMVNKDLMIQEAFNSCRFTGPLFPHIDPLKEANAERAKLGPSGAHLPLTTLEQATEVLSGSGDSDSNMEQFAEEIKYAEKLGIEKVQPAEPATDPKKTKKADDSED